MDILIAVTLKILGKGFKPLYKGNFIRATEAFITEVCAGAPEKLS